VKREYERNTGRVIVETFESLAVAPEEVPGVLVANHGPFTWGGDAFGAVAHARMLEFLARMEVTARLVAPDAIPPDAFLVDKHFFRKHGKDAYYGQP
jgi:L-ribulose-5-phosphate 4-epimerase